MRDPERIARILKLVEIVWKKVPDWRLIQLLIGVSGCIKDPFYIEDAQLEEDLKDLLQTIRGGELDAILGNPRWTKKP